MILRSLWRRHHRRYGHRATRPAEDNITFDEMPQHDFYNINDFSGEYEYKNSLGAYGEVGVAREIGENVFLSLCFYGSYGLQTCMDDFTEPVYDYQTMKYVGVLNSEIASKKHQIAFGVLIGLNFTAVRPVTHPSSQR